MDEVAQVKGKNGSSKALRGCKRRQYGKVWNDHHLAHGQGEVACYMFALKKTQLCDRAWIQFKDYSDR